MPAAAKTKKTGAPKAKGAVRAKSGCYTCRIRRKKCDETQNGEGWCSTCVRLRLECLGFGAKRPEWLRENRNVLELREKIKGFLASQGMIKGHSGAGPRSAEQEPPMLRLAEDYSSSTESPPTPTLSLSSNDGLRSHHGLNTSSVREQAHWTSIESSYSHSGLHSPHVELRPVSPFEPSLSPYHNDSLYPSHLQLPPITSNSLVPLQSSAWDSLPQQFPSRAVTSSFSSPYYTTMLPDVVDEYADPNTDGMTDYDILANAPCQNHPSILSDSLVDHYMHNVVSIQYLLADKSITPLIFQSIRQHHFAGVAARLLSFVHWRRFSLSDSSWDSRPALTEGEIQTRYDEVLPLLNKRHFDDNDAMAALHVVSAVLFDGGRGSWQGWLRVACTFADGVLNSPHWNGAADALLHCTEKVSFIIRTAMWFDVLASVTLQETPHFMPVFREVFGRSGAYIEGAASSPPRQLSMMPVMGCENHIVWAMAEVSNLAAWKKRELDAGRLSVPVLVSRGKEIERYLEATVPSEEFREEVALYRHLTSEIFRASTRVYLHSVVSGDHPTVREIEESVAETIDRLAKISETGSTAASRSVVRSTVFSIFICGCLTNKPEQREFLLKHLQQQQVEKVGNCSSIRKLLEEVWQQRLRKGEPVRWREALKVSQLLLV